MKNQAADVAPGQEFTFKRFLGRDLKRMRCTFLWPDEDIAKLDSMCPKFHNKNEFLAILNLIMETSGVPPTYE